MIGFKGLNNPQCCSKCGSQEITRSHRKNPLEFALSFAVLPWRCRVCYNRFFRHRRFQPAPAAPSAAKTTEESKTASTTA